MKKMLIIVPPMSGHGGTESVLKKVLSRNPNRYFLFVVSTKDSLWLKGTKIDDSDIYVGNNNKIKKIIDLIKVIKKIKPQVVISLHTNYVYFLFHIRRIFNLQFKLVSWIHFSLFNEPSVNTKWLKLADYHLAISDGIANQMLELGIPSSKVFRVKNPIERQSKIIFQSPCKSNFIYIGRTYLHGQKNLAELMDGLALVDHPWHLDVYGDGPDFDACQQYAQNKGISNKINWHGFTQKPFEKIKTADALLLSSTYEGLPMVILEAMSYGVPCISSNCPSGTTELIKNGKNGYLYNMGDSDDLAKKVIKYITNGVEMTNSEIKLTINDFYEDNYFSRLDHTIDKIKGKD
ncbi:glycosyltransferase [Limosilactobacillus coleohominis]|nr:glycosyltransferase [Limosilactobacillus coleohominis]